ncbi:hypothetical protein MAPG_04802 [Magnaporthiopsis poae ATCC 64411]|uniref:Uncharacterized protein n=1 Tax=Magnaporthiopsis poae (strain ATCC 64411 / 73-15) TaxID=644358 RepID=A0A0C4DXP8_MAGP6|nr:hypothetical protein MAPG_04802 [Magnaporthiopsis poae ATCC 64411]
MSTTTAQTRTRRDVLVDYELHHSPAATVPPAGRSDGQAAARSPPPPSVPWDMTHRRVPSYRPLNRDPEHIREVRTYNNSAEQVFVTTMFTGLCIISGVARAWHASFGRVNGDIFKYAIGGEY